MRSRLGAGLWDRRGTHLVVALTVAVVAAGAAFVTREGVAGDLIIPLLLLSAGVLPGAGSALGRRRRHEAALLRLRGRRGPALASELLAEPLLPIVLGGAGGSAAAWILAPGQWVLCLAVVGGAGLVVVAAMLVALRGPLPTLLQDRARALATTGPGITFVGIAALVGAGVAVLRRDSDGPGWLPFVGPVLVGLAVGVLAAAAMRAAGSWLTTRGDLPLVLVGRRLRAPGALAGLPVLVASAVLLGLATNTLVAVRDWEKDTRTVTAGAAQVVMFRGDADDVLAATRLADPEGRWLMAAVLVFSDDRAVSRRVYLDSARYAQVVGDGLDGTAAEEGSDGVVALYESASSVEPEPLARGKFITATLSSDSARDEFALVSVSTGGVDGGARQDLVVFLPAGETTTLFAPLARCDSGCRLLGMEVAVGRPCPEIRWARPRCRRPVLRIDRLNVGGLDVLARELVSDDPDERPPAELRRRAGRLEIRPSVAGNSFFTIDRSAWSAPLLATPSVRWDNGPNAPTTSNLDRPGRVLATVPALPLAGSDGVLLDLPTSTLEGGSFSAAAEALVLARDDTPEEVLDLLGTRRTPAEVAAPVIESSDGGLARDLLLIALGGLVLGLLGITLPAHGIGRDRTREHAALRVVGLDRGVLRRTERAQAWLVTLVTVVAAVIGTATAVAAFADVLPALRQQSAQLPLDSGLNPWSLAVAAVVALVGAMLAATVGAGGSSADSRPATLREEGVA